MQTNNKPVFKILFVFSSLFFMTDLFGQTIQPKVVFVIADGIPADLIERVAKPNMNKIIQAGMYKRAFVGGIKGTYNQTPSVSAPGYNNLLTGTWANKHNVYNNSITAPNYHYWSIFRFLKNQYPKKTTAVFSSWQDNRTKLIGDGLVETGGFKVDFHYDGYELDTIRFAHDKQSDYIHQIDQLVVHHADSTIRNFAPDLSWVYLEYTDDMGHKYGDGEKMEKAIEFLDVQMGQLWDAIQYRKRNFAEDWLIIITTDHGRDAATGKNHGGQSDRERTTWIVSNYEKANNYFKENEPAIIDILPSIAAFMRIAIPDENKHELDGVSFIGPVSISHVRVLVEKDSLIIHWKSYEKKGQVQVLLATSNQFKEGIKEQYQEISKVSISKNRFALSLKNYSFPYFKIVLQANKNSINAEIRVSGFNK